MSAMLYLRHICDAGTRTIPLDGRIKLIGRGTDCDIVLTDPSAPDIVAQIEREGDNASVQCLVVHKVGLVLHNGKKLKRTQLRAGDRIEVGRHILLCDACDGNLAAEPTVTFEQLRRFAEAVGREKDVSRLLRGVMEILLSTIGGTDAFVIKLGRDNNLDVFVSSSQDDGHKRFSDTIVQQVIKDRCGIVVANALANPEYGKSQSISDLQLSSVLCCPVMVAGRVLGVFYLGSRKATISYTAADLELLQVYATLAGMLVNHVDFIAHQQAAIRRLAAGSIHEGIVAESKAMLSALEQAGNAATSDIPVLLEGETGTGKDLLAHFIHKKSARAARPFVVVNCSTLQKDLIESELFGHRKGSFTGAVGHHQGLFVQAEGGTLFLDEIGELDAGLQSKLLRVLEARKIRPVGSATEESVDVRIVCATNRRLSRLVEENRFRADLYYRLNQFHIPIPPLRDRGEDTMVLAYYFLEKFRLQYPNKDVRDFDAESLRTLAAHHWPGNVRELSSAVHRAVVSATSPAAHIVVGHPDESAPMNLDQATKMYQRSLVLRAIAACEGNKEKAAGVLGIHRSTLFRYLGDEGATAE